MKVEIDFTIQVDIDVVYNHNYSIVNLYVYHLCMDITNIDLLLSHHSSILFCMQ